MEKFLRFLFWGLIVAIIWYLFVYLPSQGTSKTELLKKKYRKYKDSQSKFISYLKRKIEIDKKAHRVFKKIVYSCVTVYILFYFLIFKEDISFESFLIYVSFTAIIYSVISLFKTGRILTPNDTIDYVKNKINNYYYKKRSFNYYLIPVLQNNRDSHYKEVKELLTEIRSKRI